MNWWEEAEARALRMKSPASQAQVLRQRFATAGIDQDLAFVPAYQLAQLYEFCADFVQIVESLLETADGDRPALRRHGLALAHWARAAGLFAQDSALAFNQLLDSLELEGDALAARHDVAAEEGGLPEEQPKLEGRYRFWHLLYERLDLKLASVGTQESVRRGLARSLSRIFEQCLITLRLIAGLEKDLSPRFRGVARLLLDINTTWHFDLGPYHLGFGELTAKGSGTPGVQTWLLLAFGKQI